MSIKDRIIEFIFGVELIDVYKVQEIIASMDKDENGRISVRELIQAIKQG